MERYKETPIRQRRLISGVGSSKENVAKCSIEEYDVQCKDRRRGNNYNSCCHRKILRTISFSVLASFTMCFALGLHDQSVGENKVEPNQSRIPPPRVFSVSGEGTVTKRGDSAYNELDRLEGIEDTHAAGEGYVDENHDLSSSSHYDTRHAGTEELKRLGREKNHEDSLHLKNEANEVDDYYDDDYVHPQYAFDDDSVRHESCRRVDWSQLHHPNCNTFHETSLNDMEFAGEGDFRQAWFVTERPFYDEENRIIIKTLKTKETKTAENNYVNYEYARIDALVMERLTFSKRIVDIYGHCGTTIMTEALSDFELAIVPKDGYYKWKEGEQYNEERWKDLDSQNDLTPIEKLDIALAMAESLAELHGFEDGLIYHGDIMLSQWLVDKNGIIKLNDFNRAEVMIWDEQNQVYCKNEAYGGFGSERSPEEFAFRPIDEQAEMYSFGSQIYALLTGFYVYYEIEDDDFAQQQVIDGNRPYINEIYRNRTFAEAVLVDVIDACWTYDPNERTDIFEVAEYLRDSIETITTYENPVFESEEPDS